MFLPSPHAPQPRVPVFGNQGSVGQAPLLGRHRRQLPALPPASPFVRLLEFLSESSPELQLHPLSATELQFPAERTHLTGSHDQRCRHPHQPHGMDRRQSRPQAQPETYHTLRLSYNDSRLQINLQGFYKKCPHPNMAVYERTSDDRFIYTQRNQKEIDALHAMAYASYWLMPEKLSVTAYGDCSAASTSATTTLTATRPTLPREPSTPT